MRRHWEYLKYVLRHKKFVFQACIKYNVPIWIAIIHDWDKFLPSMWFPYARTFYKPDGSKQYVPDTGFSAAWNDHQKRNKHHWQYWLITWDRGETEALPMPFVFVREMVADWTGAGMAMGKPDVKAWYEANKDKMILHPDTRIHVEYWLSYYEE